MIAAIIAGFTLLGQILTIVTHIMNAIKEKNENIKEQQSQALQDGVKAIANRDVSAFNYSVQRLNRLRQK